MTITKLSPGLIEPGTIQTADLAAEVTANINYAMATANAAFDKANTGVSASGNNFVLYGFPLGDAGYVSDTTNKLGDEITVEIWDNKLSPQPQQWGYGSSLPNSLTNSTIVLDAGYLT